MAEPIIGIDLGTTYSCVACFDPRTQKVEVIESPSGRTMPSWVSFTSEGKLVGSAAKSQVASNPRNTVYDVKRIIGRSYSDPVTIEEAKSFPFRIVEGGAHGEPRIVVDWRNETKELRPEEISAMILAGELEIFRCYSFRSYRVSANISFIYIYANAHPSPPISPPVVSTRIDEMKFIFVRTMILPIKN
jgi:hypothetical protein